jgi:hypothetical protein
MTHLVTVLPFMPSRKELSCLVRHLGINPSNAQIQLLLDQLSATADAAPAGDSVAVNVPPGMFTLEQLETTVSAFLITQVGSFHLTRR